VSQPRILIKLGGSSLSNESVIDTLAALVGLYRQNGAQVFVVHGGGPAINAELTKKGIAWNFLEGQRITTPEMIDTIEMVLKGFINGKIVRALNRKSIAAAGLSGAENGLLQCEQMRPELQRVGRVTRVNAGWLADVASLGAVPVIAPLGVTDDGDVMNINADFAAAQIALALQADELIYLTDQKGIWDADKNILAEQTEADLRRLIDSQTVQGGMLAKTQTILAALAGGIDCVRILHAEDAVAGFHDRALGTRCIADLDKELLHASF